MHTLSHLSVDYRPLTHYINIWWEIQYHPLERGPIPSQPYIKLEGAMKAPPTPLSTAAMTEQNRSRNTKAPCWLPGLWTERFQEATTLAPSAKPTSSLSSIWQLHPAEDPDPGCFWSHQRSTLGEASGGKNTRPCSSWNERLLFLPQQQGTSNLSMLVPP